MHSLKITDFFETDLLYNFYSISDKVMSSGNLDSSVTPNRKTVQKTRKAFQILMYYKYTLNALIKNYRFFSKLIFFITFIL